MGQLMQRFDTPQPTPVTIEISVGTVHLIASDRSDTVVTVNPADRSRRDDVDAAEKTIVEFINGGVHVKGPKWRSRFSLIGPGKAGAVDVTVELPSDSDFRGDAGMGDFRVDGRLGDTHIRSGAGDVRLDHTASADVVSGAGRLSLNRADGRVRVITAGEMSLGAVDGDLELKNNVGETWVGEVTGTARVKSAAGDITVDRAHGSITAKTATGNIEVGEVGSGTIVLETAAGGLDIGVREGVAAWLDAKTSFGRVLNLIGEARRPDSAEETVEIRARTAFGDISIHRS
jgi:DUF4097 and DUF4098 domain-containing protein YvlB